MLWFINDLKIKRRLFPKKIYCLFCCTEKCNWKILSALFAKTCKVEFFCKQLLLNVYSLNLNRNLFPWTTMNDCTY